MALLTRRRQPETSLTPLFRQMEQMLSDWGWSRDDEPINIPPVEVSESDDEVIIRAQVPGMKKEDLDIEVIEGGVNIRGETKHEHEERGRNLYRSEFRYGHFSRTVPIPTGIDITKAEANLEAGVLELRVPKTDESKKRSRRIQIS